MNEKIKKYLLYIKLLMVAMFFGSTFIAGRVLAQNLPPFTSSFLRFFVAAIFLLLFLFITYHRIPSVNKKSMIQILFLALTGIIGYNFFFFSGLKTIDASRASVIVSLNPASISIFSSIFFKEKINLLKALGILLSLLGALVVITKGQLTLLFAEGIGVGELYILGCVVCWTAFTLISKSVIQKIPPLVAITFACSIGAFILSVPAWREGHLKHVIHIDFIIWLSVLALAFFGTVIAYIWYYEGLDQIGAARTGVFINFVPVWATVMAILILKEEINYSFIIGAIIVLAGVFLVNKKPKVENNIQQ